MKNGAALISIVILIGVSTREKALSEVVSDDPGLAVRNVADLTSDFIVV
jgi:hypothetical protein